MRIMAGMEFRRLARKITLTLFLAQSVGSAAFIAGYTIAPIAGAKLGGSAAWTGVPTALYLFGGAGAAYVWGYVMERMGRRRGIAAGLMIGIIGAVAAGAALIWPSLTGLLVAMVLLGAGSAALGLGRFAAAEVHPPEQRGRAISNVVVGGIVGSVVGPFVLVPAGAWAKSVGVDELSGAFAATIVLLAVAVVVVLIGLRPDPRDIGRAIARAAADHTAMPETARSLGTILRESPVIVAIGAMLLGQVVMVMLMVVTSLHMSNHQHPLFDISIVISSHTFGMYAFSIVSGRLADRWGRGLVILFGASTLLLASLLAPLSPDVLPLAVALFLLGLGWNFCYVGGSSLLVDQLAASERSRMQGLNDLLVGMVSALGSVSSGLIFAAVGYGMMALVSAFVALIPITLTIWWLVKTATRAVPAERA